MDSLQTSETWELVPFPLGEKIMGCKWVFNVKYHVVGSVDRYMAHLVAKGFTQSHGRDFTITFAPVTELTNVQLIVCLASSHLWALHQLDIKNAFLNGDLQRLFI